MNQTKRARGVVLSRQGWQKLQDAKTDWEYLEKNGYKVTLEEISDKAGLTTPTVRKLLTREQGVDKRSAIVLFSALNLELCSEDYVKASRQKTLNFDATNRKADWGEAVDVSTFFGRDLELTTLETWLLKDRCRLITIVGMGGSGKTALSIKFAQQVEHRFERVIWRSLRDAPPLQEMLTYLIQSISEESASKRKLPDSISEKISLLIAGLRLSSCLIVLDNIESLMSVKSRAGICSQEHQQYSELFLRIGESEHQSCVILTSREKPKEVVFLEGESFPVRSLQLAGFDEQIGKKILRQKGVESTDAKLAKLVRHYDGNPLALKIAGTTICDLFLGDVTEFLAQDTAIFGDIHDVLEQQFQRLLDIEKKILYWLAINREPVDLDCFKEDLIDSIAKFQLLDGLDSLSKRCLIEKIEPSHVDGSVSSVRFTLQSVVMEYITDRLVENVSQEIITQNIELLRYYALFKATAKDYLKQTQTYLIIEPIIARLLDRLSCQCNIEEQLLKIKTALQQESPRQPGYVAGNILNLLCHLETDLTKADFSNLCIWQADLQNIRLHDVSFQNCDLSKTVFSETFGGIFSVAYSPDGKHIAAGDSNGDIHLWQVETNEQTLVLQGHTNWVTSLDFSPDGKTVCSSSSDNTVKLWNAKTGICQTTIKEHQGEVWTVAFSQDGRFLATGSDDCTAKLWNAKTGQYINSFQGHKSWVTSLSLSYNSRFLATGSDDCTVKLWNIESGECCKTLQGHSDSIRAVTFLGNNLLIASGGEDCTIKLWNAATGRCFKTLKGHSSRIFSLARNVNANLLASGSHDNTVKLWDLETGRCIKTFRNHSNWVFDVAFSSDGNFLASGSRDQTIKLFDIQSNKCIKTFQGHSNQIFDVAFSSDGRMIASGGYDKTVRLWDVRTNKILKNFSGHSSWVHSVSFNHTQNYIASGSEDRTVKLWDVKTGRHLRTMLGHEATVKAVAFSPDGQIIASGSEDRTIRLWNVKTGTIEKIFKLDSPIWSMAFNPDGDILAVGTWEQAVELWNVPKGICSNRLRGHTNWVWSVAFSYDGKTIASSSSDGTLKLWDVDTGDCKKTIAANNVEWHLAVSFRSEENTLITSCQDTTIRSWNIDSGECQNIFAGHGKGCIWSISYCPVNNMLVSGSEDGKIKLWDFSTGNCLNTLDIDKLYANMNIQAVTGTTQVSRNTLISLGAFG